MRAKRVAVVNNKGGASKTTTTINLAAEFSRNGFRTLIVDLDPQRNATIHVFQDNLPENYRNVAELLTETDVLAVDCIYQTEFEGVDLLPSSVYLEFAAERVKARSIDPNRELAFKLEAIYDAYDVIVFDTPPSLGLLTFSALAAATHYLVPVGASDQYALDGAAVFNERVREVYRINPSLKYLGVVLYRYDARQQLCRAIEEAAVQALGEVLEPRIGTSTKVAQAAVMRTTARRMEPAGKVTRQYAELCINIAKRMGLNVKEEVSA